jgi:hypothetical protein
MNSLETLLYLGSLHGFFPFYVPFQLAGLGLMLFEARIFPVIGLSYPDFWHNRERQNYLPEPVSSEAKCPML